MYHLVDRDHLNGYHDNGGSIHPTEISPNSAQTLSPSNQPLLVLKSDVVPTFEMYPGRYDFYFTIPDPTAGDVRGDEDKSRGQNYKFSKDETSLPLLFAKPGHQWPLSYSCSREPPPASFIRITPVFKDPDVSQEVVMRCPNHVSAASPDEDNIERYSIIQVTRSSAIYVQDGQTNRFSVILPYQKPDEGSWKTTVNCKFICFSSCQNINRRECYLLITLECKNPSTGKFDILGRQPLHFRSCACPTRDWSSRKRKAKGSKKCKRSKLPKSQHSDSPLSSTELMAMAAGGGVGEPMVGGTQTRFTHDGRAYTLRVLPLDNPVLARTLDTVLEGLLKMEAAADSDSVTDRLDILKQLETDIVTAIMIKKDQPNAHTNGNSTNHSQLLTTAATNVSSAMNYHERSGHPPLLSGVGGLTHTNHSGGQYTVGNMGNLLSGRPGQGGEIPQAVLEMVMDHHLGGHPPVLHPSVNARYHSFGGYDHVDGRIADMNGNSRHKLSTSRLATNNNNSRRSGGRDSEVKSEAVVNGNNNTNESQEEGEGAESDQLSGGSEEPEFVLTQLRSVRKVPFLED